MKSGNNLHFVYYIPFTLKLISDIPSGRSHFTKMTTMKITAVATGGKPTSGRSLCQVLALLILSSSFTTSMAEIERCYSFPVSLTLHELRHFFVSCMSVLLKRISEY
jgi:hypothetical protein